MFHAAILKNEIGWFDEEDNSADALSMRLANDATYVRASFSNRLSLFVQDLSAVVVALSIGIFLNWRVALAALASLPVLFCAAVAQVLMLNIIVWLLLVVILALDFIMAMLTKTRQGDLLAASG